VAEERPHAEDLALHREIDHVAVVDDLDGAPAHDVQVGRRLARLAEDHRSRREVLDLHAGGNAGEGPSVQRVEGWMLRQEPDDVHGT